MRDRGRLALALVLTLALLITVLVALGIAAWGSSEAMSTVNGLLHVLLPAELTLITAAIAFYFAGDRRP